MSRSLLQDLNISTAAFLHKSNSDHDELVSWKPVETRPLSLSNTDNKIVSACIAWPLSQEAGDCIAEAQGGFLRERQLVDNIIDLDATLLPSQAMCDMRRTGAALFDLKAAFPSINHACVWGVLRGYGIPEFIVCSIMALYHNSIVSIRFSGSAPYHVHL